MRSGKWFIEVLFIICIVVLTSCGEKDERTNVVKPKDNQEEYLEQTVADLNFVDAAYGKLTQKTYVVSTEGELYRVLSDEKTNVPYLAKGNSNQQVIPCTWKKNWQKKYSDEHFDTGSCYVINDEIFYVDLYELSMSIKKFEENSDKYADKFYMVHQFLLRINVKTGEIVEVPTPQITYGELYKERGESLEEGMKGEAVCGYNVLFFADGKYLLTDEAENQGIYDGISGEKLCDIEMDFSHVTNIVTANGFLACTQYDEATNSFVLHIINENTGQEEYELDLDVKVEKDDENEIVSNFAIGATDSTLCMVYEHAIYTMDYGDTKFAKIMDAGEQLMYYLPGEYLYYGCYVGAEEDYYVNLYRESEGVQLCHYVKKGSTNNEK